MQSYRLVAFCLIAITILAGCSAAEFFIERAVRRLDTRIESQFDSLASFDRQEKQQISTLAMETAHWVRGSRIPVWVAHMHSIATELEQLGYVKQDSWDSLFVSVEQGFLASQSPQLMQGYADFVYDLDATKRAELVSSLRERVEDWREEGESETLAKQNKRIIRGFSWLLNAIGLKLDKQQKSELRKILAQRRSDVEPEYQRVQVSLTRLTTLLESGSDIGTFRQVFFETWSHADLGVHQIAPELWQHNLSVGYRSFDFVLKSLNDEKRLELADLIRRYGDLFEGLSK